MQRHSPVDPSNQRSFLVTAEVDTHLFFQRKENPPQIVRLAISFFFGFLCVDERSPQIWMIGNPPDFARDCVWRQNNVHKAGANCAARHRIELCALFTLREGQTASCFDRAQTSGAITAGSGKHDADSRDPHSSASDSKKWSMPTLSLSVRVTNVSLPFLAITHLFGGCT